LDGAGKLVRGDTGTVEAGEIKLAKLAIGEYLARYLSRASATRKRSGPISARSI
jgi:hypothetical protein